MDIKDRLRELDKKGYQPLTGAIGEEAATLIAQLEAQLANYSAEPVGHIRVDSLNPYQSSFKFDHTKFTECKEYKLYIAPPDIEAIRMEAVKQELISIRDDYAKTVEQDALASVIGIINTRLKNLS